MGPISLSQVNSLPSLLLSYLRVPPPAPDGGDVENYALIPMLRRGAKRIVLFANVITPLNVTWDANQRPPLGPSRAGILGGGGDMDDALAAFFGVFMDPLNERGWNYRMNQIFHADDLTPLVQQLQAGARAGTGAVARMNLTTISNEHWGVAGGLEVDITWVYLSRCLEWERELSPEIREKVVPKNGVNDTMKLVRGGPFDSFPHYPTGRLHYTPEQANLLAALGEWTVLANAPLFR